MFTNEHVRNGRALVAQYLLKFVDLHPEESIKLVSKLLKPGKPFVSLSNMNQPLPHQSKLSLLTMSHPELQSKLKALVKANLDKLISYFHDSDYTESNLAFLVDFVEPVKFLDTNKTLPISGESVSFLIHIFKSNQNNHSLIMDLCLKILSAALDTKAVDREELARRFSQLMQKDSSGLTLLDHSFMSRHYALLTFLQGRLDYINSSAEEKLTFSLPSLLPLNVRVEHKSAEDRQAEEEAWQRVAEHQPPKILGEAPQETQMVLSTAEDHVNPKVSWLTFANKSQAQETSLKKIVESLRQTAVKLDGGFFKLLSNTMFQHEVISTSGQLQSWIDNLLLQEPAAIAIDCEWGKIDNVVSNVQKLEENQLNLITSIQISAGEQVCFVDMFEIDQVGCAATQLKRLLENPDIVKVFHGCASDLQLLYRSFGIIPVNIFDTAAASALLTTTTSEPSLAKLVQEHLGLKMDKAYQKSNWKIRPLPLPMLDYALSDAALLLPLYYQILQRVQTFSSEELSFESLVAKIWARSGNSDRKVNKTDWKFVFSD